MTGVQTCALPIYEIHREAQQVANIKELAVKQLGFIAINGFVEQEKPYTYLDGNDIFAGM